MGAMDLSLGTLLAGSAAALAGAPSGMESPDGARAMETTEDLCAVRRDVLGHVGSKWSSLVLLLLDAGPRRYSEIRRSCRISQRMLTLTLRELERDGLVARGDPPDGYALSPAGESLVSLVKPLIAWTDGHYAQIVESRGRYAATTAAATTAAAISDGRDSSAM